MSGEIARACGGWYGRRGSGGAARPSPPIRRSRRGKRTRVNSLPVPLLALLLLQTGWKPYALGGFAFRLPSPPKEIEVPGSPKGSRYWTSLHNGKNAVVIAVSPLEANSARSPDGVLAAVVAGALESTDAVLVEQNDALLEGWPAIDYRWRGAGLVGSGRVAVVGDKMVQIGVTGPSEAAVKGPYGLSVAGFALEKDAPKGPFTTPGPTFAPQKIGDSPATVALPRAPKAETIPVGDRPGAPVVHRFAAGYGNRVYVASYVDIPESEIPKEGDLPNVLQKINDDVVAGLRAKPLPSTDVKLDGAYAIRTVAKIGDEAVARIESTVRGARLYTLIAIVPAAWKDHPEPKRFFASFRAGA